ncbi:hypothetical protein DWY99_13295 [[Clostridium] leptum]|uniref:Uncharacterized protein n=1 Tax=[Clostridium] leptum TaxID=1535 RepID=A0A412AUD2_9FIRM|nr:hypothetical protein DWY99_13295 [[Clostridium] leptum]
MLCSRVKLKRREESFCLLTFAVGITAIHLLSKKEDQGTNELSVCVPGMFGKIQRRPPFCIRLPQ